jgi:hypothetical protein
MVIEKIVIKSASEANVIVKATRGYKFDSYPNKTLVAELAAPITAEAKFVRLLSGLQVNNPAGSWIVEKAVIEGKPPTIIANMLSLPNIPTHMADVRVLKGQVLRSGVPAAVMNGAGEKIFMRQWEFVIEAPLESFSNVRSLK